MSPTPRNASALDAARAFLGSPRFVHVVTVASVGTSVMAVAIASIIGWPGLLGIAVTLVVLAALSVAVSWREIEWQGLLPLSLLVFLGWAGISIFWSQYQWSTLGGLAYLGVFTLLGLYIALMRDTIQIVRAFGDVLRFVLVLSLAIEILSGLLIDTPIPLLGIEGHLDQGGPIQGIMGSRNQLALVALIAAITFGTELRTRSVTRGIGALSLVLAGTTMLLSQSPLIAVVLVIVVIATAALFGLRRVPPARRTFWQLALLVAVGIGALFAWGARGRIVFAFNAGGDLDYRLTLWRELWNLIGLNNLQGWGWLGYWRTEMPPFTAFASAGERVPGSALNAYLDVWFQLGFVGFAIFCGMVGLTFVRSWLLAGRRRSFVFAWPALVLVALLSTSLFESSILVEYGWLTFVVCCVKAARELSWRRAFTVPATESPSRPTALS